MANARLLERLLPAMAAEAGISVAELRELMIPVDMDTTADVSSAEDDVSDVEIDADDGAASHGRYSILASPPRLSVLKYTEEGPPQPTRPPEVPENRRIRHCHHHHHHGRDHAAGDHERHRFHLLRSRFDPSITAEAQRAQIDRGEAAKAHQATESTTKPPNSRPPPPPPPRPRSRSR